MSLRTTYQNSNTVKSRIPLLNSPFSALCLTRLKGYAQDKIHKNRPLYPNVAIRMLQDRFNISPPRNRS